PSRKPVAPWRSVCPIQSRGRRRNRPKGTNRLPVSLAAGGEHRHAIPVRSQPRDQSLLRRFAARHRHWRGVSGDMASIGTKRGELLRALCVLALFFLNFAHAPAFAATSAGPVLSAVADTGFCGTPPGDGGSD